nr:hypothetical protein [Sphingobium lactosutens]
MSILIGRYPEAHGYVVAMVTRHFNLKPIPILAPVEVTLTTEQMG